MLGGPRRRPTASACTRCSGKLKTTICGAGFETGGCNGGDGRLEHDDGASRARVRAATRRRTSAGRPTPTARWRRSRSTGRERKNPLTFDSYAELRDLFRALVYASDVKAVVITGAGGNFCSGGDVHEIIGPLTKMTTPELLAFTRMTGDLVKAMRACPQPIVAAVDGVCAGAGAMIALAVRLPLRHARGEDGVPVRRASGSPAATWARARCCRA